MIMKDIMNDNYFNKDSFFEPDVSFAPVYVWVWNDECSREIIDAQLDEMQSLGIRAFYILAEPAEFRPESMPTNLKPDYLSDEFFELCAYAVRKAESLGMICWLYDEGGWPSGSACGRVLKDHPEYACRTLNCTKKDFKKGDVYKSSDEVLAAFIDNVGMIADGFVFGDDSAVYEYSIVCEGGRYPDLLNRAATEYFIKTTHEQYKSKLGSLFDSTVFAMFTDEPKAPANAFSKELMQRYESIYGESIIPYLPLIANKVKPTAETAHILSRWYDLLSRMFCDNYLSVCKIWANENGIAFTGHMDVDHSPSGCISGGNFDLMRALRCFDMPGIDVIHRQIYSENHVAEKDDFNAYNGFFPRYASSAAAQNGVRRAMSEIFGVAGPGLTYDMMRYTVGYQAVRGINIFNPFNFPLGRKGRLLAQELPVFTYSQPYYRHLAVFNRYVERLSYVAALGERVYDTALYYPVGDIQGRLNADTAARSFDSFARELEKKTVDFDIVDDDIIRSADGVNSGYLHAGSAVYRHIIIPENASIPENTGSVLRRFEAAGGKVSYDVSSCEPVVRVVGDGLRAMHRKLENGELYIFFRESGGNGNYRVFLPGANGFLLDLSDGGLQKIKTEKGMLDLTLGLGETAVLLLTDEDFAAEETDDFKEIIDLTGGFSFSKCSELGFDENGFCVTEHSREMIEAPLGDWESLVGSGYSGSGIYETEFILAPENTGRAGEINLGGVHHTASVYLNDVFLGTAIMPEYRFKIPAGVLCEKNRLKVIVTNTSANWYIHTDYFDRYSINELSPYFEDELRYAGDHASGGLLGPVRIFI